ncbi:MAG: hypothetical protein OHK0040_03450 [bacterium]
MSKKRDKVKNAFSDPFHNPPKIVRKPDLQQSNFSHFVANCQIRMLKKADLKNKKGRHKKTPFFH